jgi:hypothetical protein
MFAFILSHHRLILCLLLLACFSSACSSRGQQAECDLNVNNAPDIRGMRLGMTIDEFRDHFYVKPWSVSDYEPELNLSAPNEDGVVVVPGDFLEGGKVYSLEKGRAHIGQLLFIDGRVAHFRVVYEDFTEQVVWDDVDRFVSKTSEGLGLPARWTTVEELPSQGNQEIWEAKQEVVWYATQSYGHYWHPADRNEAQRFLLCGDIFVSAGVPFPGKRSWTNAAFIQFDDLSALRKVNARVKERLAEERHKEGEQREGFKP